MAADAAFHGRKREKLSPTPRSAAEPQGLRPQYPPVGGHIITPIAKLLLFPLESEIHAHYCDHDSRRCGYPCPKAGKTFADFSLQLTEKCLDLVPSGQECFFFESILPFPPQPVRAYRGKAPTLGTTLFAMLAIG
jgi:hypothetical protein